MQDSFQERRHRILSSLRLTPRRSERRHHSHRQFRKGGPARHRTERQNGTENGRTQRRHHRTRSQTDSKGDREEDPDVKEQIEAEQGTSEDLKTGTKPTAEPRIADPLTKGPHSRTILLENTDRSVTDPSIQDMPPVSRYPRLNRGRDENSGHTGDSDHQVRNKNGPDNLTLWVNNTEGMKSDSTNLKSQENRNTSGIHEKSDLHLRRYSKFNGQGSKFAHIATLLANETHLRKVVIEMTTNHDANTSRLVQNGRGVRSCILLSNGTVAWREPDTSTCREKATQEAEEAAEEVTFLTASPLTVDPEMFTRAVDQLAKIADHAAKDPAVST